MESKYATRAVSRLSTLVKPFNDCPSRRTWQLKTFSRGTNHLIIIGGWWSGLGRATNHRGSGLVWSPFCRPFAQSALHCFARTPRRAQPSPARLGHSLPFVNQNGLHVITPARPRPAPPCHAMRQFLHYLRKRFATPARQSARQSVSSQSVAL